MPEVVHEIAQLDRLLRSVRDAAIRTQDWIAAQPADPLSLLRRMKFETVGFHPVDGRALNIIEQINQTWTFAVALTATRKLLEWHPNAGGFLLAPGAHAAQALDIMSGDEQIGAETFAAVDPRNNRKLEKDIAKLMGRPEKHRYVFFMSPRYPANERRRELEPTESMAGRPPIEVWSVHL